VLRLHDVCNAGAERKAEAERVETERDSNRLFFFDGPTQCMYVYCALRTANNSIEGCESGLFRLS
jgi:hypothetical protein